MVASEETEEVIALLGKCYTIFCLFTFYHVNSMHIHERT